MLAATEALKPAASPLYTICHLSSNSLQYNSRRMSLVQLPYEQFSLQKLKKSEECRPRGCYAAWNLIEPKFRINVSHHLGDKNQGAKNNITSD
jgi:hypothetical protein